MLWLLIKKGELIRQLESVFSHPNVDNIIILNDKLTAEKEQKTSVQDDELYQENRRRNETFKEEKEQKTRVQDSQNY